MGVADLHCDLLWYLANDPSRTVFDAESQTSVPFFKEGGVVLQIFPIYAASGPGSILEGANQFKIYDELPQRAPDFFGPQLTPRLAIENASSFCLEDEPIEEGLKRLESWWKKHPIVYISLTWNEENRFGGGAETQIGLKEDGKKLLRWLSGKKIAVDLSHASDLLAEGILEESLDIIPIASHSNFRSICPHRRNLPDHLAQEIVKRGGIIGLNLVRHFLGVQGPQDLIAHIHHAQKLGIKDHLCLGADFFGELDIKGKRAQLKPYFFEGFSTPACFPKIKQLLLDSFAEEWVENLMYRRLMAFLRML